jgi:hypothetical protein
MTNAHAYLGRQPKSNWILSAATSLSLMPPPPVIEFIGITASATVPVFLQTDHRQIRAISAKLHR